ncbi:hypothetical protein HYFRA_00002023 [Hymenoscyphus fraxineus]|uniref:Uncharacterized protein n=1 Tax=Hymenoscyphus fraxineus TaxID=746836 RepID=A0A9N9KLJ9_9HELO|nr:hypothetical protein HYFRA_00002023 [Hymenoscyphus fraxineus]
MPLHLPLRPLMAIDLEGQATREGAIPQMVNKPRMPKFAGLVWGSRIEDRSSGLAETMCQYVDQ